MAKNSYQPSKEGILKESPRGTIDKAYQLWALTRKIDNLHVQGLLEEERRITERLETRLRGKLGRRRDIKCPKCGEKITKSTYWKRKEEIKEEYDEKKGKARGEFDDLPQERQKALEDYLEEWHKILEEYGLSEYEPGSDLILNH